MPSPTTWQASRRATVRKEKRKGNLRKRAKNATKPTFLDIQELRLFKKWRASGIA